MITPGAVVVRRIRVLSESARVIMCVPHARVRTCDYARTRGGDLCDYVRSAYAERFI